MTAPRGSLFRFVATRPFDESLREVHHFGVLETGPAPFTNHFSGRTVRLWDPHRFPESEGGKGSGAIRGLFRSITLIRENDAVTVRHARDDCCARPTGADPTSAGRRG